MSSMLFQLQSLLDQHMYQVFSFFLFILFFHFFARKLSNFCSRLQYWRPWPFH